MPVAKVTALYRKHMGRHFVRVNGGAPDLDVTASRTGERVFLHVVNTHRTHGVGCRFAVEGREMEAARAHPIAADPSAEFSSAENDPMEVDERAIDATGNHQFPPASVTAVELDLKA